MIRLRRSKPERAPGMAEAEAALKTSVNDLHAAVVDGKEVRAVAQRLRQIQHRNHFAESIRHAYGRPA